MAARDGAKLSKQERRVLSKQLKSQKTLLRHENITCCNSPTKHILVANGGLGNDIELEELWMIFHKYGSIVDIVMKPRKPFAFISFFSVTEATDAVAGVHGRVLEHPKELSRPNVIFYLSYVEKIPEVESINETQPPSGLVILEDFVSQDYEQQLLDMIDWEQHSDSGQILKHRQVKHYGYQFMYGTNNVDREHPLDEQIPQECSAVFEKLLQMNLISKTPDQLTINQYSPGQGIPPHVDTHSAFEDIIVVLSLQSQIVMDFCHPDGTQASVLLPRRSLAIMSGESRFLWTHGITPRKSDVIASKLIGDKTELQQTRLTLVKRGTRTSFTFRNIRHAPCNCMYVQQCDTQMQQQKTENKNIKNSADTSVPVSNEEACKLESIHVHQVYEKIAHHFSSTRHTPWPQVVKFLEQLPKGSFVADVGCGNGKYLAAVPNIITIGCDRSINLCEICHAKGNSVIVCDGLSLPFRDGIFDAVICIAVIHHLSTEDRRVRALEEIARILRHNGKALIYVWALEQEKDGVKSKYLKKSTEDEKQDSVICQSNVNDLVNCVSADCNLDTNSHVNGDMPVHKNRTSFTSQDLLVPWHVKAEKRTAKTPKNGSLGVSAEAGEMHSESVLKDMPAGQNSDSSVDSLLLNQKTVAEKKTRETVGKPEEQTGTFHRYYHIFEDHELEQLCSQVPTLLVVKTYYDQGNWCIIVERI